MSAPRRKIPAGGKGFSPSIETLRGVAVLLLVAYHVIGSSPTSGLMVGYPHPLRIFADAMADVRMPLFACIAGYVYGLRPLTLVGYPTFVAGKFRRLVIPGGIACTLFAILSMIAGKDTAPAPAEFWTIYVYPYAHYWFLQAILVIFALFGLFDAATGRRGHLVAFVLALGVFLVTPPLKPDYNILSMNAVVYLLPFFLVGLILQREQSRVVAWWPLIMAASLLCVLATGWVALNHYSANGVLETDRRDLTSLAMGLGICTLAILALPRITALEWIGPYSLTIYLYHVFATALMYEILVACGAVALLPLFAIGLVVGIAVPVALHRIAARWALSRRYILGIGSGRKAER